MFFGRDKNPCSVIPSLVLNLIGSLETVVFVSTLSFEDKKAEIDLVFGLKK